MGMRLPTLAIVAAISAACGDGVTAPNFPAALEIAVVNGIAYEASASFAEDAPDERIVVTVTATNETTGDIDIEFGGCPVRLLVYRNADRSGEPAWDDAEQNGFCPAILWRATLSPGASQEFQATYIIREILGGSLPDGRYYFTAVLRLDVETVALKAGDLELTS